MPISSLYCESCDKWYQSIIQNLPIYCPICEKELEIELGEFLWNEMEPVEV